MKTTTILLGHVGVDSGQIVVCDPCYIKSEYKDEGYSLYSGDSGDDEFSYQAICEKTVGPDKGGQLYFKRGHAGVAVAASTGYGDGYYPVFAEIRDCGEWGERVSKIWVEFIDENEEE